LLININHPPLLKTIKISRVVALVISKTILLPDKKNVLQVKKQFLRGRVKFPTGG